MEITNDEQSSVATIERDLKRIDELISTISARHSTTPNSTSQLQQLQQLIRSPFFTLVKEVYEHVHSENVTPGDVASTAKATAAIFAIAERQTHPRVIVLPKTDQGLGFNVMGGKEQSSPIYISRIIPGGVADRHGGLRRGDQLLAVDGISVESECHEVAVRLLKGAAASSGTEIIAPSPVVKLVVRYTPKLLEEMERRFEEQHRRRQQQQQSPLGAGVRHRHPQQIQK